MIKNYDLSLKLRKCKKFTFEELFLYGSLSDVFEKEIDSKNLIHMMLNYKDLIYITRNNIFQTSQINI